MSEISVLERSLVRVMDGQDPEPGWDNPRFGGHKAYLDGVYSGNWQPLQNSVRLWLGIGALTRVWWLDFFKLQLGLRVDRREARGWMANEPFSSVYEQQFIAPVLSVHEWARRNGDEELADLARQWLRVCWIWKALTSLPVRPRNQFFEGHYPRTGSGWACPCAGARSFSRSKEDGARVGPPQWLDAPPRATWALPLALGETNTSNFGFLDDVVRRCGVGWHGLEMGDISALETFLEGMIPSDEYDDIGSLPPIRGSVRIRRYDHGIATWAESMEGWSNATAPLEATVLHDDGRIEYLASNSGARHGISPGPGPFLDEGSRAIFLPSAHDMGLWEEMPWGVHLPEGDLRWDLRWDHQGARLVDSDETPPIAEDPAGGSAGPTFPPDDRRLPPGWPASGPLVDVRDERLRLIALRARNGYINEDQAQALRDIRGAADRGLTGEWP